MFQTTFYDKYFLDSVKDDREVEFVLLKQRDMSASEYEAKFVDFSKFSSYLKHHHDEKWKVIKFERGLKLEIRDKVITYEIKDFAKLVNKCKLVEQSILATEIERNDNQFEKRGREGYS